jgi:hypothetical protein
MVQHHTIRDALTDPMVLRDDSSNMSEAPITIRSKTVPLSSTTNDTSRIRSTTNTTTAAATSMLDSEAAVVVYPPSHEEYMEQKKYSYRNFEDRDFGATAPSRTDNHRYGRNEQRNISPSPLLLDGDDMINNHHHHHHSGRGRGRGRGSDGGRGRGIHYHHNSVTERRSSWGNDSRRAVTESSNDYNTDRRRMEEIEGGFNNNSDRGTVRRREDEMIPLSDRNSDGARGGNFPTGSSDEYGRGRIGNTANILDDVHSIGGRGRGRGRGRGGSIGDRNEMSFGRGRGRDTTTNYGREIGGRSIGVGRQSPLPSSGAYLRITDPNPLKTYPYRDGPSPVNDPEHRQVDTSRSTYSTATSIATKSPRDMYDSNKDSSHRHMVDSTASSHTKQDHSVTTYSSYSQLGSSSALQHLQTQEQSQQRQRSTPIPTPSTAHDDSRKLDDSDRMITDDVSESKTTNVHETDLDRVVSTERIPPPTTTPSASTVVVLPPDISTTEPSGLVMALLRLADLETQMEYEYAKHEALAFQQKILRAEYKVLESMPIGMASYQSDYEQYLASMNTITTTATPDEDTTSSMPLPLETVSTTATTTT